MSHHNKWYFILDSLYKWNQFTLVQFLFGFIRICISRMSICCCIAMPRKMFIGNQNLFRCQPTAHCICHILNRLRIRSERAVTDHLIVRIGQDIRYRRKVRIKPKIVQILSDAFSHLICLFCISLTSNYTHVIINRQIKSCFSCKPCNLSAFLIHTQEHRKIQTIHTVLLNILQHCFCLLRRNQIGFEINDSTNRSVIDRLSGRLPSCRDTTDISNQLFRKHHKQLSHFFLNRK